MTKKVKSIKIQGIRGINDEIMLDFSNGGNMSSMVIHGSNGTGKSSVVDSFEWLYRDGMINRLKREEVLDKDLLHHSNGTSAFVQVEFDNGEYNKLTYTHSSNPKLIGDHLGLKLFNSFSYFPVLRYNDLQTFIYYTKKEKYEYFSKLLGLDEFLIIQQDIYHLLNQTTKKYEQFNHERENIHSKVTITKESLHSDIQNRYKIDENVDFNQYKSILFSLKTEIETKVNNLTSLQKELDSIYQNTDYCYQLNKLKKALTGEDAYSLDGAKRTKLFEIGKDLLELKSNKNQCPLCFQLFKGDLLEHINLEIRRLEKNKEILLIVGNIKEFIDSFLQSISIVLKNIEFDDSGIQKVSSDQIKLLNEGLIHATSVREGKKELDIAKFENALNIIESFINSNTNIISEVKNKIDEIIANNNLSAIQDDYDRIVEFETNKKKLTIFEKQIEYLTKEIRGLEELYQKYKSWFQAKIDTFFKLISADVGQFFNHLEHDRGNDFHTPTIALNALGNKDVKVLLNCFGSQITQPIKYLSESQLNSLGLSIFLASVKYLNNQSKFIILDDVVNSFDIHKRTRLLDLVGGLGDDWQFLITTRDIERFDHIKNRFRNRKSKEFKGWTYGVGPHIEDGLSMKEKVEHHLAQKNHGEAGYRMGRYLEYVGKLLNEGLEGKLSYKQKNDHTLSPLFEALTAAITKLLSSNSPLYKSFVDFGSDNCFRNTLIHYKEDRTGFTIEQLQSLRVLRQAIETQLYCEGCNKRVKKLPSSDEVIICNCGSKVYRKQDFTGS